MCLYFKNTETALVLVGLNVDDLLVTSNNAKLIDEFFEEMKTFDVKDLGIVSKFLGMKVEDDTARGYSLSQQVIANLVELFGMQEFKPVSTPIAEVVLSAEDIELLFAEATSLFRTLAGALL
jgi:hypothetical protein